MPFVSRFSRLLLYNSLWRKRTAVVRIVTSHQDVAVSSPHQHEWFPCQVQPYVRMSGRNLLTDFNRFEVKKSILNAFIMHVFCFDFKNYLLQVLFEVHMHSVSVREVYLHFVDVRAGNKDKLCRRARISEQGSEGR